jgi:citrate synthase
MRLVADEAEQSLGRRLPINVTGAIGAIASEMAIPWSICRGLGLMARPIGLVAHLLEEIQDPMAGDIWGWVEAQAQGD